MTDKQAASSNEKEQNPENASRRKAVRTIAVGSAIVGAAALIPLGSLSKELASNKSKATTKILGPLAPPNGINSDQDVASVAFVNLGQVGTGTVTRDNTGAISSISYVSSDNPPSVTASISVGSRNSDGSIGTINASVNDTNTPGYTLSSTATVNRNPDGSISNVVWTGSSTGGI